MTVTLRRGLLPVLFALFALLLSVHQSNAAAYMADDAHSAVHLDIHAGYDDSHPVHSISCCSMSSVILTIGAFTVFYDTERPSFSVAPADMDPGRHLRAKHFRPPRLA
jgi:hypothetical protein